MAGTLYLVPTPIGNLGDLSPRCIQAIEEADFIAAEDTRVSLKLLNHLGVKKPMTPYHRHNFEQAGPKVVERLLNGETCALMTDAGTPAISDPGEQIVTLCIQQGIPVVSLPGPCALITALTLSGLPTGRFTFEGFLPMNKKNRREQLDSLRTETRTMIFYEAPHKIAATVTDLRDVFGPDRQVSICRELTKLHEEVLHTTLGEAADLYGEHGQEVRGEFVLVVAGGSPREKDIPSLEDGAVRVEKLQEAGMSLRDASKLVAKELELSKNQLYQFMLEKVKKV